MYYMFGFLFLVFIILVITCSEATILLCYFHLCAEVLKCSWNSVALICPESLKKHSFIVISLPFHRSRLWFGSVCYSRFQMTCVHANILSFIICIQDYHWWWRSFLTSGFTAVYLFIYAVHYFFSKLQIVGAASTILYFGYTLIMVLIFFLFTGEVLSLPF